MIATRVSTAANLRAARFGGLVLLVASSAAAIAGAHSAAAEGFVARLEPGVALAVEDCREDGGFRNVAVIDARRAETPLLVVGAAAEAVGAGDDAVLRVEDAVTLDYAEASATARRLEAVEVALVGALARGEAAPTAPTCAAMRARARAAAAAAEGVRPETANAPVRQPEPAGPAPIAVCANAHAATEVFLISAHGDGAVEIYFPAKALSLDARDGGLFIAGEGALIVISRDMIAAAALNGPDRLVVELPAFGDGGLYLIGLRCAS